MTFPVPGNISVQRQVRIINWIKIAQGILTISVFILGIARLATLTGRRSRSDSWIIGVSAKSLVVLLYEVLTERVPKFRRWGSLKAYSILNCIEFVFWMAATIITGMGLSRRCSGTSCVLGVIIILVTITLIVLAVPTAYIALSFFFHVRKHGTHPDPYHHDNEPFHLRAGSGSTSEVKGVERV